MDPCSVLDLSMSLNPLAPDVVEIVRPHLSSLSRYPDARDATRLFAEAVGVDPTRVVLTNGGSEAIALVAAKVRRASVDEPEFSLYRRHLDSVDPRAPGFRSNPNNPTGRLAGPEETALVWDEAFYPLATGSWTRGDADRGSVVVGSMTKLLACPGLRIGYVIAPEDAFAANLAERQPEWSVGSLALAAMADLLSAVDLTRWSNGLSRLRKELGDLLERHGFTPEPSAANYVLVKKAEGLRHRLASRGVAVRECASFGLEGCVRIAVPGPDGLARLEKALEESADMNPGPVVTGSAGAHHMTTGRMRGGITG
jgi:histidinol-phosphate/aromatic aminotransferase/cobyric acid decarboxylase-like protein